MSREAIHLSCEDFEMDGSAEILMERYTDGELSYAMYASSSKKDGIYDNSSSPTDLDNDGDIDEDDRALFLIMANAFAKTCNNEHHRKS